MEHLLYIDPGTGTILLQMLIAGFVTLISFSKRIKILIKDFFANLFKKK
jgi:hypothetical protein